MFTITKLTAENRFIVVAACVMTFEARDSAAKVVPARFRFNQISTINNVQNQRNRKSTSSQTARWDHQLCKYRANKSLSPMYEISRNHIVTEFIQISKEANEKMIKNPLKKSPSAPNLLDNKSSKKKLHNLREGCLILNPKLLRRHALSVDNSGNNSKQRLGEFDIFRNEITDRKELRLIKQSLLFTYKEHKVGIIFQSFLLFPSVYSCSANFTVLTLLAANFTVLTHFGLKKKNGYDYAFIKMSQGNTENECEEENNI
ncbi:hypothetical protein TSAR_005769 [Trichomalopsis sarcophagae]|uniref:Uncharacterized protein n=1 Tax=Trichomalopsis sarcophagae TaxID=543379 RepID=A0A232EXD5_9HYME|nr:hypothetical protein TSAR_005769 [Trichomalopsis sarcophagae]